MEIKEKIKIQINTEKTILSAKYDILKTPLFIKNTKNFLGIDFVISKIAEGIILADKNIFNLYNNIENIQFKAQDTRQNHSFYLRILPKKDKILIIFIDYKPKDTDVRLNDRRFLLFVKLNPTFEVTLSPKLFNFNNEDFVKLYHIWNNEGVNYPLLTSFQKDIIEKEDENVLVQGVAGSGKTNICINKIVFSASRGYLGKVLYTTFSRGLLIDTQTKIKSFCENLKDFLSQYANKKVVFVDNNYKTAIEQKLGVYLNSSDTEANLILKIKEIVDFLENKVDYKLLEDFYIENIDANIKFADEYYFIKQYLNDIKNHQVKSKLSKINYLSNEVIFKEIYGMIFGCCNIANPQNIMNFEEYYEKRRDSFNKIECEILYSLSLDYKSHITKNNLIDNNIISRELLHIVDDLPKYSLSIIDEVQDITEIALFLLKKLSIKIFAVGDALQMINPSFFSFSYLKRLLYEKDIVTVKELAHNYRNSKKIVEIIEELSKINTNYFGTHNFVIKGKCVDTSLQTEAVYIKDNEFIKRLAKENFDDITIIVSNFSEKERLRAILKKQEILTVSEIKGLERDTVVLYNILSSNFDKWKTLERVSINRKVADENSVYRYYFNLFYVGLTRAKSNLFVAEDKEITSFKDFFGNIIESLPLEKAVLRLSSVASKILIDEDELLKRVKEFINAEQYDNARFTALKIMDYDLRENLNADIDVSEQFIRHGKYREAGIAYWEKGFNDSAKKMFKLSNDESLIDLIEASSKNSSDGLNIDIVDFYPSILNSETAKKLIIKTINEDLAKIKKTQKDINSILKNKIKSTK